MARLARPQFSLATLVLAMAWSAVVVWLNVTPRLDFPNYVPGDLRIGKVECGWPLGYAWIFATDPLPPQLPGPELRWYWSGWSLTGDFVVGALLVVVLTWASNLLLRRVGARLQRRSAAKLGEQQALNSQAE
jgi:hypothetical protein